MGQLQKSASAAQYSTLYKLSRWTNPKEDDFTPHTNHRYIPRIVDTAVTVTSTFTSTSQNSFG